MTEPAHPPDRRIIRAAAVAARTGKSRTSIWRGVRAGTFPSPVQLGSNSIGFYEDEVDTWLASRPRVTYATAIEEPGPEMPQDEDPSNT